MTHRPRSRWLWGPAGGESVKILRILFQGCVSLRAAPWWFQFQKDSKRFHGLFQWPQGMNERVSTFFTPPPITLSPSDNSGAPSTKESHRVHKKKQQTTIVGGRQCVSTGNKKLSTETFLFLKFHDNVSANFLAEIPIQVQVNLFFRFRANLLSNYVVKVFVAAAPGSPARNANIITQSLRGQEIKIIFKHQNIT